MTLRLELVAIFVVLFALNLWGYSYRSCNCWLERTFLILFLLWLLCSLPLSSEILLSVIRIENFENLARLAFISRLKKHIHIHCELYGVASWSGSEIILTSFETVLPGVDLHSWHFLCVWICQVKVQWLWLANVRTSPDSEIHEILLRNFPNSLVEVLNFSWNCRNTLNWTVISHN